MRRGLAGDRPGARAELLRLAHAAPGTNTGAWSLYQAGLASRSLGHPGEARRDWNRLQREYPAHTLSLRVASSPVTGRSVPFSADCGPRALAHALRAAGRTPDIQRLTAACATDAHGTTLDALEIVARHEGLQAVAVHADAVFLRRERPHGLAWVDGIHYVYFEPLSTNGLLGLTLGERALIWDPNGGLTRTETWETLARRSQGVVLLLTWAGAPLPKI